MNSLIIFVFLAASFGGNQMKELKCESEGCYEVIKVFAELLEQKISASDAILAEAENELNEITFGNDESFKEKIKEVDEKLTKLITEINTAIEGGDKTLMELINSVFDDVRETEYLTDEVENLAENEDRNAKTLNKNLDETQELIRELKDELNRMLNATTIEGPEALQNAFDRSEKFHSNASELKNVLGQVKLILEEYEENLVNAKKLTSLAIAKFVEVSQQTNETLEGQKEVEDKLKGTSDMKLTKDELKVLKALAKQALDQTNEAYDDAFDLLNEVSKFELENRLEEINEKVKKLNEISDTSVLNLKDFADENTAFLDEMEETIEEGVKIQEEALLLQDEIEVWLEVIEGLNKFAKQAILDENTIIEKGREILSNLQDFTLKVDEARESARRALETIPEILHKINSSEKIIEKLENKLDAQTKTATDAKEKCTTAKEQMLEILEECEQIKEKILQLGSDFSPLPEEHDGVAKTSSKLSNNIDELEKKEAEDSKLIEGVKENIEKTKSQAVDVDEKMEEALRTIQNLTDQISKFKDINVDTLNEFEKKLNEAENELDGSQMGEKLLKLRAQRHDQTQLIERYRLEVAALEYQASVLKKNAESLESKCFKRTRLEP